MRSSYTLPILALLPTFTLATSTKVWKEPDLRPHTTADEPPHSILLALNRTVYDVTGSPRFYGPGGPYHHFTGRDASRAWVTECWDDEAQLTWRMDGLEAMFMPRYLDELMDDLAGGREVEGMESLGGMGVGREQMVQMAKMSVQKTGGVSEKKRAQRREEDAVEAKGKVEEALRHWVGFFEGKYEVVGSVEYVEDETPAPPAICEKAMQKRPVKGGKLEGLMGMAGMMGDGGPGAKGQAEEMPDFVKERLRQKEAAANDGEGFDERDEL